MSHTADAMGAAEARTDIPVTLGRWLMLVDLLWGAIIVLGIGFEPLSDFALDLGFLGGLPAYVLDARSRRRIIIFLPALYLVRWFAVSRIGPGPHNVSPPWRGNLLLFTASVLLQWSKLRRTPDSDSLP